MNYPISEDGIPELERTSRDVKWDMVAALKSGEPSHSLKGPSPLMNLPGLDLVWGIWPVCMHCVLERVSKQLCEIWLSVTKLQCYIGSLSTISAISSRLWFTCLPRTIMNRQYWKASELKWWLLYYAVLCLEGILPQNLLNNVCLLVSAIFLLKHLQICCRSL